MKKGFTLIELLVVVLIIGILAAVALPRYNKAVARSRAAEAILLGSAIVKAEKIYYMVNEKYTDDLAELDIQVTPKNVTIKMYNDASPRVDLRSKDFWFCFYFPAGNAVCAASATNSVGREICRTYGTECSGTDGTQLTCKIKS